MKFNSTPRVMNLKKTFRQAVINDLKDGTIIKNHLHFYHNDEDIQVVCRISDITNDWQFLVTNDERRRILSEIRKREEQEKAAKG